MACAGGGAAASFYKNAAFSNKSDHFQHKDFFSFCT